jgi:chaperonin GroES
MIPLGNHVLIRRADACAKSAGGIVLPENAKDKPREGTVVAVGAGKIRDDGSRIAPQVTAGDRVIFSSYAGNEIRHLGEDLMVLAETEILAIIR